MNQEPLQKKKPATEFDKEAWLPKSSLGKKVKLGEIKEIDETLSKGLRILEPEIVDALIPNLEYELLGIGQSKGKFGGGKRSIWKQTQKKTREGNKPKFSALVVIGNRDGYVGIGRGKSKETVPAREKAIRQAKLNIIKVPRGSGSWESNPKLTNSIPHKVVGKFGGVKITLIPAPPGTGLVVESQVALILKFAGIKDIYSKATGTRSKLNLAYATFDALKKLSQIKNG